MYEYTNLPRTAYEIENDAQFSKASETNGSFTHYLEECTGYTYDVAIIQGKTVMFDNFSVAPFVVSDKHIDEEDFLKSLEEVYENTLISKSIDEAITEDFVRKELAKVEGIEVEEFMSEISAFMKATEDEYFFTTVK